MHLQFYFERVFHNKTKRIIAIIALLLPLTSLYAIIRDVLIWQLPKPDPHYVTFLAGYSGHFADRVYLWILPLYFLLIASEDTIEDHQKGYRLLMVERSGKKNYIRQKLMGSFWIGFLIMMGGILLDYLVLVILFHGATYRLIDLDGWKQSTFFMMMWNHPVITNIVYGLMMSAITGLVAMTSTAIALVIKNRKIVYALSLALWIIITSFDDSIFLVIQPFQSFSLSYIARILFQFLFVYIGIIALCLIWEKIHDEV